MGNEEVMIILQIAFLGGLAWYFMQLTTIFAEPTRHNSAHAGYTNDGRRIIRK